MNPNTLPIYSVHTYNLASKEYIQVGFIVSTRCANDATVLNSIKRKFPPLRTGFEFRFALASISVHEKYTEKNMIKSTLNSASTLQAAASASKFVVGSFDSVSGFSMSDTPTLHDTAVLARSEAARLAKLNPGKYFVFLQLRGGEFVKPEPSSNSF